MKNNIFSGLEDLGLDGLDEVNLFEKTEENIEVQEETNKQENELEKQLSSLYAKEVVCPICGHTFKAKAVKTSSYRVVKKDSDFFIRYDIINPYFYDVWLCNFCGYTNTKADYYKIKEFQKPAITSKITPKWHGRNYPEVYDVNVAIERYKLALFNSCIYGADSSKKAMNCLKIAWMYRLLDDNENESTFINQAIEGFNDAYMNEHPPIYGMDNATLMYLIGELYRRVGDDDNSLIWFSRLITSQGVDQKIKEMARNQKDLIRQTPLQSSTDEASESEQSNNKKGFFSKFFK